MNMESANLSDQDVRDWILQDVTPGKARTEAFIRANLDTVLNEVEVRRAVGEWVLMLAGPDQILAAIKTGGDYPYPAQR